MVLLEENEMATSTRPLKEVVQTRRATQDFDSTPIPDADLKQILEAGRHAPSGYNLQPWRFIVVRDPEQRKALRGAAFNQPKVESASVVIVAVAALKAWKQGDLDKALADSAAHGFSEQQIEGMRKAVNGALGGEPGDVCGWGPDWAVWGNRQTMIAFTHMMLMAESLGYDTAPMEGMVESQVKQALGIPADNEQYRVVAMLAIGHKKGDDKPFAGRFPLDYVFYDNKWGNGIKL
jgi:nitroreductase